MGANGIHHGAFRHEIGNPDLKPEQGYSLDFGYTYNNAKGLRVVLSPFINYFSNFIYLEPTKEFSLLPHAGQKYKYNQAETVYAGVEYDFWWAITNTLALSSIGEYVYNRNIDNNYPMPFSPPLTMKNKVEYKRSINHKSFTHYTLEASHTLYARQDRIAQGEEKTPGANLFALSAGTDYKLSDRYLLEAKLMADNIFDKQYFNHLSFYRKLNLPEPGRNIRLILRLSFR